MLRNQALDDRSLCGRDSRWRESTRPLLGTFVTIAVGGVGTAVAEAAIERGFAAIERVHLLMSFHAGASDLGRLNAAAPGTRLEIDSATYAVLELAERISSVSDGIFDITIAPQLVAAGRLPRPESAGSADGCTADVASARWTDLVLDPPRTVIPRRRLWADLGGIAKGYAVDAAAAALQLPPAASFRINAGGDLRVGGPEPAAVALDVPISLAAQNGVNAASSVRAQRPLIELQDGSLASSSADAGPVAHYDGRQRSALTTGRFVSVVAERCAAADALTKVVLVLGAESAKILAAFGATAYVYAPEEGWQRIGGAGT